MSYLGIGPASFTNNLTNVQILDDIKSGFNGSTTTFNLTASSIPFQAVSDRALMVILGGVIQAPGVDYTINGSQITFTTAPLSGLTFYARNIYGLNALNGVNDGIVVPASLSTGGPSWDTSGNTTISGNLTVQGATTTISSTTLDIIDKDIKLASNQSTNAGIDTAGLLWGTTSVKLKYYNNGGTNPGLNIEGTNVGIGVTAPTAKLHVDGDVKFTGATSGRDVLWDKSADELKVKDNIKISFGTDRDLQLSHNNSDSVISHIGSATGNLKILSGGAQSIECVKAGAVNIAHNGSTKLATTSSGISVTGSVIASSTVKVGDSVEFIAGDGNDLRLWHNSTDSYIKNYTGDLWIQGDGDDIHMRAADDINIYTQTSDKAIVCVGDGAVEIYHNNLKKIETTSSGATVTGDITISDKIIHAGDTDTAIRFSAADTIQLETGGTNRLKIDANGVVQVTRRLELTNSGDNHYVYQGRAWAWSSNGTSTGTIRGYLYGDSSGNLRIGANSDWGEDVRITSAGNLKLPDDGKIEFGGAQSGAGDLQIYHAAGADSTIHHTATSGSTLRLRSRGFTFKNQANSQTIATFNEGDACKLFFSGGEKLATTGTGISVTGKVVASGEIEAAQDYPTIRPIIDFNFAAVKELDPRITYYRHGTASYIDENGIVKFAPPNEPRFDHDPVTKESRGFLIEESKVNNNRVAGQEWKVETATGWAQNNWKKEHYPSETAPDGLTNTTLMYPNTDNDTHYSYINHAGNGYTGRRTISCWFKNLSSTIYYPQLRIFGVGNGVAHATFTLTGDGSVSSGGSAKEAATITPYPNGWYRCTLSWNHGSGHYGGGIVINNSTSAELPSFAGNSDKTKGFLAWGFQDEPGGSNGNFPTSFIPSDGAAAPADTMITPGRGADYAFIEDQHFTDLYNVAEGTFLVKASVDDLTTSNQPMWGVEKSSNRGGFFNIIGYRVGGGSSGYTAAWYNNNGNTSAFVNINTGVTVGTPFVTAFGYKLNDMAASTNGSTPSTDTSASIASDGEFNRFTLGSYHYDSMSVGHIQRAVYYRQRLTNAQLKNITS